MRSLSLMAAVLGAAVLAADRASARPDEHEHHAALKCAKVCAECQFHCDSCFKHCLTLAAEGKKEHAVTAQLCADCAECCKTCAALCARNSHLIGHVADCCAKCCDACAAACEKSPDDKHMAACAKSCRECAKECRGLLKPPAPPK